MAGAAQTEMQEAVTSLCARPRGELLKAQVPCAQSLERGTIRSDDVRVDRFGGRYQPGVILAQASGCTALQLGAPPRLRKMQSLNRKPLQ